MRRSTSGRWVSSCTICKRLDQTRLSGKHPFVGEDDEHLSEEIRDRELLFSEDIGNYVSPKVISMLRQMLYKDPKERPSAHDLSNSIWLNYSQSIPSTINSYEEIDEINLIHTVQKVGRYIYKQKLKKTDKKLKALLNPKVSKKRMHYCCMEEELSMFEESMMTEGECG